MAFYFNPISFHDFHFHFSIEVSNLMAFYMILGGDENDVSIQHPLVVKFILSKEKIVTQEMSLMKVRSLFSDASFRKSKALLQQATEQFKLAIVEVLLLLGIDKDEVPIILIEYRDSIENPVLLIEMSEGKSTEVTLNDENLVIILDMLSPTKECVRDARSPELWSLFSSLIKKN